MLSCLGCLNIFIILCFMTRPPKRSFILGLWLKRGFEPIGHKEILILKFSPALRVYDIKE